MSRVIKWALTVFYNWLYKYIDPELCCCGASNCDGDYSHSFRSVKEYAVTSAVNAKLLK